MTKNIRKLNISYHLSENVPCSECLLMPSNPTEVSPILYFHAHLQGQGELIHANNIRTFMFL